MRRLIIFASVWLQAVLWAGSPAVTVLSWNMQWFPSGSPKVAAPEVEAAKVRTAAEVLRGADADILVLQEVRDGPTVEGLAREIGGGHQMVICSAFRDGFGSAPTWQQIAIISRVPTKAAWAEIWTARGAVDPPRGFAFACFEVGDVLVAVYGLHLKSNLRDNDERQHQLNMLQRELAVDQFLAHRQVAEAKIGRKFDVVIVAGDFNTMLESQRFVSEGTLRKIQERGFTTEYASARFEDRVTVPAKGGYPAAVFDYIFQIGGTWQKPVSVLASDLSDHHPIVGKIELSTTDLIGGLQR